ncbi:MAG: sodium-translocating pyrophosphatase [Bacilli bacterium]|nr:sodium-translocating pyrophosphatase [Bacilli bacterium]
MEKVNIILLACVLLIALITIGYVFLIYHKIRKLQVVNKNVEDNASYIRSGAITFLKREFKIIVPFILIVALVFVALGFIPAFSQAEGVGWQSAICFVAGAAFSALAGLVGMLSATNANSRTADAANESGLPRALHVAFSGGAVLGLCVVGFGLIGLTGLFFAAYGILYASNGDAIKSVMEACNIITGYGLGCSMVALFGRVGGGIYTKCADVGADIVGKIEADIDEDDARNPATIADNVGDNVGDIAGMSSDLCESYVGSIISAMTLGSVFLSNYGIPDDIRLIIFPLALAGLGIIASIISVVIIRLREWKDPQKTLDIATYIAVGIVVVAATILSLFYLKNGDGSFMSVEGHAAPWAIGAIAAGLACGIAVGKIAEIYTSADYKTVKNIAKESETGHATNIISGFASGMKSTAATVIALALGIIIAYFCFGIYGIGLAAVGMLSTAGITISVDGYGPISDNAGGLAQMSGLRPEVREITDHLDAVGNTTAAVGKGFCTGSATFTALALVLSFGQYSGLIDSLTVSNTETVMRVDITPFIIGVLVGVMVPFLFSSLVINSVGKAANKMVLEIRQQFKEHPGILAGTEKPDYNRCIDIATRASLKEMIVPGIVAVVTPILVGILLGREGLGALLIGGLASSGMLAIFMANSGGAWDNAKKYIEQIGKKGTEAHHAAVTGDTVGDPLKDTAGPTMDILIKMMSVIALIMAPMLRDGFSIWHLIVK